MGFDGFGPDLVGFYEGLEADNSREYFTAHKAIYDDQVAAPLRALGAALAPHFGDVKVFRPYRDLRFTPDRSPYKTAAALVCPGGYLSVSADGLFIGDGLYDATTDQSRRLRAAAADERTGPALTRVMHALNGDGWTVDGTRLKRIPKPWDDSHPRADLLRLKTMVGSRMYPPGDWLGSAAVLDRVSDGWRALAPLGRWLTRHVGPPEKPRPAPGQRSRVATRP